jgi:hypothetical protein
VSSDFVRHVVVGLCAAVAVACFDPLYAEGDALSQTWVICCAEGAVKTCLCDDPRTCGGRFVACAGGACSSGSCGGSIDAGQPLDGGSSGDGGVFDGGVFDGGVFDGGVFDGGVFDGGVFDAGVLDAGVLDAGSSGDAGVPADTYEFCCRAGQLTTCVCPQGFCAARPFTPCANATCIEGTTTGLCR